MTKAHCESYIGQRVCLFMTRMSSVHCHWLDMIATQGSCCENTVLTLIRCLNDKTQNLVIAASLHRSPRLVDAKGEFGHIRSSVQHAEFCV